MDIKVKNDYIKIYNSYQFSKNDFDTCLQYIKEKYNTNVFDIRSLKSLKREWAVHNFCYRNNLFRNRTADVTFETNISKWLEMLYNIIGSIVIFGIE